MRCFIVELEEDWLARTGAGVLVEDGPRVFDDGQTAWLMARLRREFRLTDAEAALTIEGLVLELIAGTSRRRKLAAEDRQARWLRQAREFLDDSFSQPLTLSVIAQAVGVHPVYLANSFRRHYQCSVGEYLRRRRVEFACHRLSASKDSLTNVALAAGFSSHSHFSRTFKRVTGMTPAQYKAALGVS
jgi:AraC family transcriptional regulator